MHRMPHAPAAQSFAVDGQQHQDSGFEASIPASGVSAVPLCCIYGARFRDGAL